MFLHLQFESFALQLARNPLKINVMGLYSIEKSASMSMGNTMIKYALLLIQYDIQYF